MREIRQSGSEGGAAQANALLLPLCSAPPGTPAVVGAIQNIQDILIGSIHPTPVRADPQDLEPLTRNLHVEACRRLGWTAIPAIIRPYRGDAGALPHGRGNAGG
jgi:hypothetical protein